VSYIKGGGMVIRSQFGAEANSPGASFLVDTGVLMPLAMSESGWKKAGTDPSVFPQVPGDKTLRQGSVAHMSLGDFDVPNVPGVFGLPMQELAQGGGIHLDGVIGAGLVANFRVSLVDQGRTLWLEQVPAPYESADEAAAEAPVSSIPTSP
jgi:hypothetical protein